MSDQEREIRVVLLDGSEVIMNTGDRVLFQASRQGAIPLSIDADGIIDDVLAALEESQQHAAEAITFEKLVEYGKNNGGNIINGMPWSFNYMGHPITHENDECYLIPTSNGIKRFTPQDVLVTGVNGEIYPCRVDGLKDQLVEAQQTIAEIHKEATAGNNGSLERADTALNRIMQLTSNMLALGNKEGSDKV